MMTVEAQIHIWAKGTPSAHHRREPYSKDQALAGIGPKRVFGGTDITRMPCSWRQCVTLFTEELPWLTAMTSSW